MPTPLTQQTSTTGDTAGTITTNYGGAPLTSDFPAPATGTGAGADSVSSVSVPNSTSPNYVNNGGASPAVPVATTTSTENVATHTTKFL